MAQRLKYLGLTLLVIVIAVLGFFQMFERAQGKIESSEVIMFAIGAVLFLVTWGIMSKFQPNANQTIMCCMELLAVLGILMIARLDITANTTVATRQLIWLCVALVCANLFFAYMHDYRVLRRFSYVSMVIGLVLLLSPMVPGLGREIGGARIWIGIGPYQLQPGEFAKLFLAFFFASYLFNHRDQLAVGGKKVLGLQLPRIKDLGPIIIVWITSMGVLVLQRDLGTSLMFFAMFVAMLYIATGRTSWLIIGFLAFIIGCVAAVHLFPHVSYRVEAWLHPFDKAVYDRYPGGSSQLVTGLFGLAAGGLFGTGLGAGSPNLTPLANSDFIYASLGEELGLVGVLAILLIYMLLVTAGLLAAMKIKDGFGKLLAAGLAFSMAFQVFTVVGGITLVIPLTGLTMPYMAAGGSSLVANTVLAALLVIISNQANTKTETDMSETFRQQAIAMLRHRQQLNALHEESASSSSSSSSHGRHSAHGAHSAHNVHVVNNASSVVNAGNAHGAHNAANTSIPRASDDVPTTVSKLPPTASFEEVSHE
ncbi:cell cycle protein, FtsW/RodA/SpoVE family [Bifidobacterium dolichotidis]|uniref:Cell cycle protein, FtsW/RodA/SpoVE family n=1 Tax=Bifidobacterium dolichotidis TaxID=2306976 RepID=A0A430FQV9_9BIFI|nr:FtsW/RodA/SpoVE family cell cycle protein [Bifidobacterium dolichotidis]RSX55229.1 cell cycle protein, FtsW/RodA/SpoVE family [Bifidobacterium dolichotidis]